MRQISNIVLSLLFVTKPTLFKHNSIAKRKSVIPIACVKIFMNLLKDDLIIRYQTGEVNKLVNFQISKIGDALHPSNYKVMLQKGLRGNIYAATN